LATSPKNDSVLTPRLPQRKARPRDPVRRARCARARGRAPYLRPRESGVFLPWVT